VLVTAGKIVVTLQVTHLVDIPIDLPAAHRLDFALITLVAIIAAAAVALAASYDEMIG
jgi:hypothetical protein